MAYEDYFTGQQFNYAKTYDEIGTKRSDIAAEYTRDNPLASMYQFGGSKPTLDAMVSNPLFQSKVADYYTSLGDEGVFGGDKYGIPESADAFKGDLAKSYGTALDESDLYNILAQEGIMGIADEFLDTSQEQLTLISYLNRIGRSDLIDNIKDLNYNDAIDYTYDQLWTGAKWKSAFMTTITDPGAPSNLVAGPFAQVGITKSDLGGRGSMIESLGSTYEEAVAGTEALGTKFGSAIRGKTLGFGSTGLAGSGAYRTDMEKGLDLWSQEFGTQAAKRGKSWADIGTGMMEFVDKDVQEITDFYNTTTSAFDEWYGGFTDTASGM